ncbi:MAG: hypothetical protein N2115_01460 [bacterium]|nr:hypothetical protein [bacterium]
MDITAILEKHDLFWQCKAGPLLCKNPPKHWFPRPYPLKEGKLAVEPCRITPSDLDVHSLIGKIDENNLLTGELINSIGSMYPASWMEAIAGCDIFVSAYGCVAKPVVKSVDEAIRKFSIEKSLKSDWFAFLSDFMDACIEISDGKVPVQQPHLRGVVDIVAAFLGEQVLCESIYDSPDELKIFVHLIAELFLEISRYVHKKILPWYNHYVSCWKISAPRKILDYQIDASSLFNPQLYFEFFGEMDQTILKEFSYSIIHIHSIGTRQIQHFLTLGTKTCVEISLDREAVPWNQEQILSVCHAIQAEGKPVLLDGMLSDEELNGIIHLLDSNGLAINYWNT